VFEMSQAIWPQGQPERVTTGCVEWQQLPASPRLRESKPPRPDGGEHVVDKTAFDRLWKKCRGGATTSRHAGRCRWTHGHEGPWETPQGNPRVFS